MDRARLASVVLALFVLFALPLRLDAEEPSEGSVVGDVITMLDAEVSENLIVKWLESDHRLVEPMSAEAVIGLSRAGASEDLVELLLELSDRTPEDDGERASPKRTTSPDPPAAVSTGAERLQGTPKDPADSVAGGAAQARLSPPPVPAGYATVDLEVSYRATFEEDEEGLGLGIYLDGEHLERLSAKFGSRYESVVQLPAGPHRLVLVQEDHSERRSGWYHSSRVSPTPLDFEIPSGRLVKVEAGYDPPWRDRPDTGPLFLKIEIDNQVVANQRDIGDPADQWRPLCEDLEAMVPTGKKIPYQVRKGLEKCVRWPSLWPEGMKIPSREEILATIVGDAADP